MLLRNFGKVYKKGLPQMSNLYDRIEKLCQEHNESITTMCKESGASRASLSDLKVGRKQSLSAETLSKIAAHFNVSVDYLLGKRAKKSVLSEADLTEDELRILSAFREMSPERQKALADLLGISDS